MIGFNYLGKLGQLGNQMFQYASALGVAEGIGTSYCIPKHDDVMVDALGNRLRVELFDAFKINPENVGLYQHKIYMKGHMNLMNHFLN